MTKTEYSMICALCIALSAAVQIFFASFGANCAVYFSVLICAVCCPLKYGVLCAVMCPLTAMMTLGSPAAALLPAGVSKCLLFVLFSRLMLGKFSTGNTFNDVFICLLPSVCLGQVTGAMVNAAIFCEYSTSYVAFVVAELIAAIPQIIILLAVLPGVISLLRTMGIVEARVPARTPKSDIIENNKSENDGAVLK